MKKKLQIAAGLLLGLGLIWLVFKDTDWAEVWEHTRRANLLWLSAAIGGVFLSFLARVQRWTYVVRSVKPASYRNLFSATQIGFMANFTLPARIGELVRALVLSKLEHLPISKSIALVALDRITDIFGLLASMLIAALAYQTVSPSDIPENADFPEWAIPLLDPATIQRAALVAAGMLCCGVIFFVVLYLQQRLVLRISDAILGKISVTLKDKVHDLLQNFADGLHVFRSGGDMAKAIAWSLFTWSTFALSYACIMKTFGIDMPWYAPFVMISVVAVAISLPNTPGFVGVFHAAVIAAMFIAMPDTDADVARAVAIMGHLINLVPIVGVGLWCLHRERFGLTQLRSETAEVEEQVAEDLGLQGEEDEEAPEKGET